jgi:myo-inositol-1-phosphate synthase
MSAEPLFSPKLTRDLTTPPGKLGVLLPGLGAVATTLIAGIHLVNKKLATPFGSLTQMQKMCVGPHANGRFVPMHHRVPLAALTDLVFGGWEIFPENAYQTAVAAGVLPRELVLPVRQELEAVQPWPAVFERAYVPKLSGKHIKRGPTKMHLAEAVMHDIEAFMASHRL